MKLDCEEQGKLALRQFIWGGCLLNGNEGPQKIRLIRNGKPDLTFGPTSLNGSQQRSALS
jgi:hypothetical protein